MCVGGKFNCEVLKKLVYIEMQYSEQGIFNWLSQIGGFFYLRSIHFGNSKTISQLNSE